MITLAQPAAIPGPWMDAALQELQQGRAWVALDRVFAGLNTIRERLDRADWLHWADTEFAEHPLFASLMEDPMLKRSYEKPRGYPGDAVLLDYIYRIRQPHECPSLGREIWDHCTSTRPAALAVQARRRVIGRALDELAERPVGQRRALAVACGHLREGHLSDALRGDELDEVLALDSDSESLAVVERLFGSHGVTTDFRSAARLLGDKRVGEFDLVYSAGLYDYLEEEFARRLTASMFRMLRPGGRLLVCNFVPQIYDAGFMEAAMGWRLIYRDEVQILDVAKDIPESERATTTTWTDPFDAVSYLMIERAS